MKILNGLWRKICEIPLPVAIIIAALLFAIAIMAKPKVRPWNYQPPLSAQEKVLQEFGIKVR